MNLHINQILVDNSNGEMDLGALGHISRKIAPSDLSLSLPRARLTLPCVLLSRLSSVLKSEMQNELAWLFGENRNCLSTFMMCSC